MCCFTGYDSKYGVAAQVVNLPGRVIEVSCGQHHTVALFEDGTIFVFGDFCSSQDHAAPTALRGNTCHGSQEPAYSGSRNGRAKITTLCDEVYDGEWVRPLPATLTLCCCSASVRVCCYGCADVAAAMLVCLLVWICLDVCATASVC